MSPEQVAKSGTEDAEQAALFCWARERINEDPERYACLECMFAIPNGGSRGGSKAQAMSVGARLKATGVKAGVSDIFLPECRHGMAGLFIEMKRTPEHGGGVVSQAQKDFGAWVQGRGYGFCVCYGWVQAAGVLEQYLS